MDITRTIKTKKVHAVYYNPELACEVSEDVNIIGEKSNDDIEKILSKRRPLFIRFEYSNFKFVYYFPPFRQVVHAFEFHKHYL